MTPANDRSHKPHGATAVIVAMIVVILLPIAYVLATGPIAMIYDGAAAPDWIIGLYSPLSWVLQHSEALMRLYMWYISFWVEVPMMR